MVAEPKLTTLTPKAWEESPKRVKKDFKSHRTGKSVVRLLAFYL